MNPHTITLLAHALGWTLLHFCWQGILIAAILSCVLSLLSDRSPQPRYLASCCALLLMAVLPVVTFIRILTASHGATHTITTFIPLDPATTTHSGTTLSQPILYRIIQSLDHAMPTILIVWSIGVALLLIRLSIGLIITRHMKSATTQPPPHDLLHTFQQIARRIEVTRPVRLLHSALVQVPTVIGWLRPVVLIPLGCFSGLSSMQIEAILAHELAHIRRHDYLISVLQSIVESLLFYHPAVWWVSQRIRREREHCCDDLAVTITGDPLTYARALSHLEEHRSTLPTLALGANGGTLTMRIKRLLTTTQNPASSQLAALALFGVALTVATICITTAARAQSNQATQLQTSSPVIVTENLRSAEPLSNTVLAPAIQPLPNPSSNSTQSSSAINPQYQAWLDQDVHWNIAPEERAAFLQLTSDAERDHFIEQFWQRRNPVGAAPNTAREEHYRRIAYANQHFAASPAAGWETDRGRVYIVNGPPNTIDSHPTNGAISHPIESWTYSATPEFPQGVELKFVDLCNCGNYQLQSQTASDYNLSRSTSNQEVQQRAPIRTANNLTARHVSSSNPPAVSLSNALTTPTNPAPQQQSEGLQNANIVPRKIGGSVSAPTVLYTVPPEYTEAAKQAKVGGNVLISLWVDEQGNPQHVRVTHGLGRGLDQAAITAVKQYKFKPAMENGQPVLVQLNLEVNFQIF